MALLLSNWYRLIQLCRPVIKAVHLRGNTPGAFGGIVWNPWYTGRNVNALNGKEPTKLFTISHLFNCSATIGVGIYMRSSHYQWHSVWTQDHNRPGAVPTGLRQPTGLHQPLVFRMVVNFLRDVLGSILFLSKVRYIYHLILCRKPLTDFDLHSPFECPLLNDLTWYLSFPFVEFSHKHVLEPRGANYSACSRIFQKPNLPQFHCHIQWAADQTWQKSCIIWQCALAALVQCVNKNGPRIGGIMSLV